MRRIFSKISDQIKNQLHYWLHTSNEKVLCWLYYTKENFNPTYLFVANTSDEKQNEIEAQNPLDAVNSGSRTVGLKEIYTTCQNKKIRPNYIVTKGKIFKIKELEPGECRIYKVIDPKSKKAIESANHRKAQKRP